MRARATPEHPLHLTTLIYNTNYLELKVKFLGQSYSTSSRTKIKLLRKTHLKNKSGGAI